MNGTIFGEAIYGILIVIIIGLIFGIYVIFQIQKEINKWETIRIHSKKCGDDINCIQRVFNFHKKGHIFGEILEKCKQETRT